MIRWKSRWWETLSQYEKIQPAHFINENKLLFAEGNAIKYICRHQSKGKEEDVRKAIHYLEMILERDYSGSTDSVVHTRNRMGYA